MQLKNVDKRSLTQRSGGKKKEAAFRISGLAVKRRVQLEERSRYKPLMVHAQCPGTADRAFNNHPLTLSLVLISSLPIFPLFHNLSLSLSPHTPLC